ncbi:MAG: hypothetical protein IT236_13545, partial [Bacteroidia bacterium]|nr:hypothetical protein [Bacteroidia bacterium]
VKADFEGLMAEFNKIKEEDVKAPAKSGDSKAKTFDGGKQLVITHEIYDAITGKIKSLRNSYTQTK